MRTLVIHLGYRKERFTAVIDGVRIGGVCEQRRMLHEFVDGDVVGGDVVGEDVIGGEVVGGGGCWQRRPWRGSHEGKLLA